MHHKSSRKQRIQHQEIVDRHTNGKYCDSESLRRFRQKPYLCTSEETK